MSFLSNFHYSILGTNTQERVVFIHGLMAFAANWRKIANRLEDDFQCLIYDQRGHGRSFKPESGYSPEIFAEDLDKITTELGWDSFHLVGHSMGGRNAMVFANLYPHKVRTLTIEDMGPDSDPSMHGYYENMLGHIPTPFANKSAVKYFFDNEFKNAFSSKEPPAVLSTFLQANLEERTDGTYDWRFSKHAVIEITREGHLKDRWLEVSSFKMPVLLIRGENSHILKQETFDKMLAVNPNIQGVELKGAGHWVHFEKFEEFVQSFRQFVASSNA
ncbi:alpha/beta hydrolase [Bdellovibrio sp. qaytius]|nr:alpha/beta hydrolase [Bdellovibrio sp. qaytius]